MDILLLGGTGAIGTYLVKRLSQTSLSIYVTSRTFRKGIPNVTYIQGNAKDLKFIENLKKRNWDCIVDFMNYGHEEFDLIVPLYLSCTKKYVFISSSRVYSDTKQADITEASPMLIDTDTDIEYLSSHEYGLTKAKHERRLKNFATNNWVIVRPYITYSETRLQLGALEKEDWLQRALEGKHVVLPLSLKDKYTTLTFAKDVADVMAGIIIDKKTLCQVYNIAAPKQYSVTWGEIAVLYSKIIGKLTGNSSGVFYIKEEDYKRIRPGKLYYQTSKDRAYNRIFDTKKIEKYKNNITYTTVTEGLYECLSFFVSSPHFAFCNQKQEAVLDSITGEHSNLFRIKGLKQKLIYLFYRYIKY